jgi:hypothetical protein
MTTVESKTLDFLNTGLGLVKAAQEQFNASVAEAGQKVAGLKSDLENSMIEIKNQAEKTLVDLKVKGSLDNSSEAQKLRETAINAVRKFS